MKIFFSEFHNPKLGVHVNLVKAAIVMHSVRIKLCTVSIVFEIRLLTTAP